MQIQNFKQRQSSDAIEARFQPSSKLQQEQIFEANSHFIKKHMRKRNIFEHQLELGRMYLKHLKVPNDFVSAPFNPINLSQLAA